MLNIITIMGRMVRDPELRRTGNSHAVASFTVAVERDYAQNGQKEVDYIDCVAWRQTGEFVSKYFKKGNMIVVTGRLQIRNWNDKDGNKRKSAEVLASNCYFGESKSNRDPEQAASNSGYSTAGGEGAAVSGYPETQAQIERARNYNFDLPYPGKQEDFALLDDEDGQLPF